MTRGLMKTASGIAIAAAAGLFATSAMAADLGVGGNCCADLEERVAELEATTARKGNRKVSLTVYGMVTKAIVWHDDDWGYRPDELSFRDYGPHMSRFGFRGEAAVRPDLTAGYVLEFGLANEDNGVHSGDDPIQIRHSYVYLDHASLGRISLGQQSTATDGAWQVSLANTLVLPGEMNEGGSMLSVPFRKTFASDFDGHRYQGIFYRSPTVAGFMLTAGYFTNTYQEADNPPSSKWFYNPDDANDAWDIALRYAGEFNGVRVAAAVGYRKEFDNGATSTAFGERDIWMASGSVMHTPTGLFVSGGYADRDSDLATERKDAFWIQAGIEKNWTGIGNTTIFGEYAEFNVSSAANADVGRWDDREGKPGPLGVSDGNYWGIGIVQTIDAAATDLFLNLRKYELDGATCAKGPGTVDRPVTCNPKLDKFFNTEATIVQGGMKIQF